MKEALRNNKALFLCFFTTFLIYLLTIRFPFMASGYVLVAIYMLFAAHVKIAKVVPFILFFLFNVVISLIVGFNWRETSLLLWLMLIIPVFQTGFVERKSFLKFLNITYLLYLFLSVLVSFQILPAGFDPGHQDLNQFDALLGETDLKTLVGFGGSTADIDSYSVLVSVYNILFNRKFKQKVLMAGISGIAVLATFRFTPLLSVFLSIFVVLFGSKAYLKFSRIAFLIIASISFLVKFAFPKLEELLFLATHGRSEIWYIYINIMRKAEFDKFLFGYRQAHLPSIAVSIYQDEFSNAHSSFLRIFMHWGIIVYVIFILYLLRLYFKTNNRKIIFVQSVIFTAAITNMNIFWNDNPIYFFVLFYLSYYFMKEGNNTKYSKV